VGSGGGAFAAAIAARERELRVVMIERGTVGGTCVNVGCIPSKTLLAAAEARHRAGQQRFPGIRTQGGTVDFAGLIAGKDQIIEGLRQEKYLNLAQAYGFALVAGDARFVEGPALDVGDRRIEAAHYLVATGAEPHIPDIPGLANSGYLTSTTAMELDHLPPSMLVLGGGYVALEQAQLFAHLGTAVTMLVRSQVARTEEPEIAATLREALIADGIVIHERTRAEDVRRDGHGIVVRAGGDEFRAEQVLVATGRSPRTAGLDLAAVGVAMGQRGEVVVDADMSTTNPRIWAAGDVTGHPQFVYVAAKQGGLAVENAFAQSGRRIDYSALPRITFTNPTIASAGLTEAQAQERGVECECRVLGSGERSARDREPQHPRAGEARGRARQRPRHRRAPARRRSRGRHPRRRLRHSGRIDDQAAREQLESVSDHRRRHPPSCAVVHARSQQTLVLRRLIGLRMCP
jgi:mercuric reductase